MFFASMSSGRPNSNPQRSFKGRPALFAAIIAAAFTVSTLPAAAQATKTASTPPPEPSRFDLYGGYGYFHPFNSSVAGYEFQSVYNPNATVGVSTWFNRYFGGHFSTHFGCWWGAGFNLL